MEVNVSKTFLVLLTHVLVPLKLYIEFYTRNRTYRTLIVMATIIHSFETKLIQFTALQMRILLKGMRIFMFLLSFPFD